jgi:hypothetical protein
MPASFRAYVPPPDHPRRRLLDLDFRTYSDRMLEVPFLAELAAMFRAGSEAPFVGVTADGRAAPDLFAVADEGAPTEAMTEAAGAVLRLASPAERAAALLPLDAPERRQWSNPEVSIFRHGLRLEELSEGLREAILQLVKASLSDYGYRKARDCMSMNAFLGEVMGAPKILNAFSYNFALFGEPSTTEPWGWQLHGHHLALNAFVLGPQMVMTPCFWGAEPNEFDDGAMKGRKLFSEEERKGLDFMLSLPPDQQGRARLHADVDSPGIPPGRKHFADHLHLAGAGRDNRVIPYEGLAGSALDGPSRARLLDLAEIYHRHLPDPARRARMGDFERHLADCHFCWIGGTGPDDPFYYRIQSPVAIIEFDHHAGVFLTNATAKKFHIHTLMRTPNGNDFGMSLLRQCCEGRQARRVCQ